MSEHDSSDDFHKWAKDAGNKLRAYILSYASGATAVFFVTLIGKESSSFTASDKSLLVFALVTYVAATVICLYELHVDARRFFHVAKQLELPEAQRDWAPNVRYKALRLRLIYASYVTVALATLAVVFFLVRQIT